MLLLLVDTKNWRNHLVWPSWIMWCNKEVFGLFSWKWKVLDLWPFGKSARKCINAREYYIFWKLLRFQCNYVQEFPRVSKFSALTTYFIIFWINLNITHNIFFIKHKNNSIFLRHKKDIILCFSDIKNIILYFSEKTQFYISLTINNF